MSKLWKVTDEIVLGELFSWYAHSGKLKAHVYRFTMSNKVELPDFHIPDIVSFGPYVLISDEELIWVFELSEIQSLEIQIYFDELPEVHSMKTEFVVPYELISHEELDYFDELAEITVWTYDHTQLVMLRFCNKSKGKLI
jgi:hypothetical protein